MGFLSKFINKIKRSVIVISDSGARSRPVIDVLDNDTCNAIIACNTTHIAKAQILHVIKDGEGRVRKIERNSAYAKLFRRLNFMMTRQDFISALAWQLMVTGTAFAWIKWDERMRPVEIWPLIYLHFQVVQFTDGTYGVIITDNGDRYTVRMEDLVVLRTKYDGSGYAGGDNSSIMSTLNVSESIDEALEQAVQISNKIHGVVKTKNSMLSGEDSRKMQEEFIERMKSAAKNGGIVGLDGTEEYTPLSISAWSASAEQMNLIRKRINNFWRTPEEVVDNTAKEQVIQNYYDAIVEPVWCELGESLTNALFTAREQDFGNEIIVTDGSLSGASMQTKLRIISSTKDIGLLSINEQRAFLDLPPVEGGDERLVSLNYVKSTDQSLYQTGKDDPAEGEKDGDK